MSFAQTETDYYLEKEVADGFVQHEEAFERLVSMSSALEAIQIEVDKAGTDNVQVTQFVDTAVKAVTGIEISKEGFSLSGVASKVWEGILKALKAMCDWFLNFFKKAAGSIKNYFTGQKKKVDSEIKEVEVEIKKTKQREKNAASSGGSVDDSQGEHHEEIRGEIKKTKARESAKHSGRTFYPTEVKVSFVDCPMFFKPVGGERYPSGKVDSPIWTSDIASEVNKYAHMYGYAFGRYSTLLVEGLSATPFIQGKVSGAVNALILAGGDQDALTEAKEDMAGVARQYVSMACTVMDAGDVTIKDITAASEDGRFINGVTVSLAENQPREPEDFFAKGYRSTPSIIISHARDGGNTEKHTVPVMKGSEADAVFKAFKELQILNSKYHEVGIDMVEGIEKIQALTTYIGDMQKKHGVFTAFEELPAIVQVLRYYMASVKECEELHRKLPRLITGFKNYLRLCNTPEKEQS